MPYYRCNFCFDTGCMHCRRDLAYRQSIAANEKVVKEFLDHAAKVGLVESSGIAALAVEGGPLIAEAIEYGKRQERERSALMMAPVMPETRRRIDMLEFDEVKQ